MIIKIIFILDMVILVKVSGLKYDYWIGYWIDIDVLLVIENMGLLFVLIYLGVMYVCGYDIYMLVVLGILSYFVENWFVIDMVFMF